MKKHMIRMRSLLLVVLMMFSFSSCSRVKVTGDEMIAVFRYGDIDIKKQLSDEESEIVRKIFDGKLLISDSPSCGFGEDVALIIDGNTYCIACDNCGLVYSVEEDMYFGLSDKENETLRNLLCENGFIFPCV